jgi:hypothetical protein
MLRAVGKANQPWGMTADERAKHYPYAAAILGRVPGDTFQSVEGADSYVDVIAAELLDSTGEAIGELPFTVDLNLSPGSQCADYDEYTTQSLQQSRSSVVLQLSLSLLQLNA